MYYKKDEQSPQSIKIHISIIVIFIVLICVFAGTVIFKYEMEGEKNAPFTISKILIVSTAEGINKENSTAKWDININQNNDIYLTIEKNNKKQDIIKSVIINNFQIIKSPEIGNIQAYKPAEKGLFRCEEKNKISDELVYKGSKEASLNNLEISNQGGSAIIRFCTENITNYVSESVEQIVHDGTLLKNTEIKLEQLNSKIQFDVIIETEKDLKYRATIETELPVGNIIEDGTCTKEIQGDEIILKRI